MATKRKSYPAPRPSSNDRSGSKPPPPGARPGKKSAPFNARSGRPAASSDDRAGGRPESSEGRSGGRPESSQGGSGGRPESSQGRSGGRAESFNARSGGRPESSEGRSGGRAESSESRSGGRAESFSARSGGTPEFAERRSGGRPGKKRSSEKAEKKLPPSQRPERPVREDLVLQACLEAYGLVRHEGRLSDRALEFTLRRKSNLYSNERRAVAERVYGLLRRQRTVDFLLSRAHSRFDSLDNSRQDVLRLAASRVLYGEPPELVARASALGPADAAALNALPEAAEALEALPSRERFPIAASLPDYLAERFREVFGADAARAAEAMNERAPLNARVNLLKGDRDALIQRLKAESVEATATPLSPLGLVLETRLNIFSLESFRDGLLEIQDEGSQLLGLLVDAPPTRVVDACAGAGGKTLQLAAQMKNRGDLHALDVDAKRLDELKKRARRAGVHNVRTQLIPHEGPDADAALAPLKGKADRVLVDAPCSGTGTFRRKPDARYRLSPEDLEMHVGRQKALLARFATLVKPGGRLIYGTCSVLREENEAVVEDFLSKHPEFTVRPVAELLGPELGAKVGPGPYLRLAPHLHGTDGFFGAILVRAK